jgi:hypothetical protein
MEEWTNSTGDRPLRCYLFVKHSQPQFLHAPRKSPPPLSAPCPPALTTKGHRVSVERGSSYLKQDREEFPIQHDLQRGRSETMSFPFARQTFESDVLAPVSSPFATVHRQRVAKSPMSWRTGYYLRFGCAGNVRERSTKPA